MHNCMSIECICLIFLNCIEICVSGIFPEIAWRAAHSRQAAHASLVCFWFPEEPPGSESLYR